MSTQLQKNGSSQLVKASTYAIEALASPQVTIASPQDIFKTLNMAITKAYLDTGNQAPVGEVQIPGTSEMVNVYQMMLNDLVLYVRMKLGSLRVNEIPLAISAGCMGELGEYYGLNKKTFVQFLTVYCHNEDRKKRLAAHLLGDGEAKVIPSYEQQFDTAKGNVLEAYAGHLKEQKIDRLGVLVYDFLYYLGLMTYTEDQNTRIYQHAMMRVKMELKADKANSADMFTRQGLAKMIEYIDNKIIGPNLQSKILAKAKFLTMGGYFDACKLSNINLAELIESKRPVYYKHLADVESAKS